MQVQSTRDCQTDNLEFVRRLLAGTHRHSVRCCGHQVQDPNRFVDEKSESRLYIGNLDLRITEATLIKMFSPFGEIVSEDFLWHSRGPKRGEPRGYAFIQFRSKEEAKLAKEKMHGKLVSGRPLVVRLASEKYCAEMAENSAKPAGEANRSGVAGSCSGRMDRSAKIAAIKNKLKAMEEESRDSKKQKQAGNIAQIGSLDPSPVNIQ
ncbi:hypothetical protein RJ640_023097 [Escallonia rubra]|uniref:Probable RNA-binding protein 18 n=1 Tax=Escallonia rubra TaxID=112253 RepID=A0AA88UIT6_9ASTE|nr:hypothetical protein RJ640_023097 [Escallonia rubra]